MKLFTKVLTRLFTPAGIFVTYLQESARILNQNLLNAIIVNIAFGAIITATHVAIMFLAFELSPVKSIQAILLGYINLPITSFFLVGLIRFYTKVARKEPASFTLLFRGYRNYFQMFVLFVVYYTLYILLVKIISDYKFYEGVIQIRLILGVFFFFWLLLRFIFAPLFVVNEENCRARQAMKNSFALTSGRTIKTFLLIIFVLTVFASGFPVFLIGIVYTFGLSMIILVIAFDINLKNEYSYRRKLIDEVAVKTKKNIDEVTEATTKTIKNIAHLLPKEEHDESEEELENSKETLKEEKVENKKSDEPKKETKPENKKSDETKKETKPENKKSDEPKKETKPENKKSDEIENKHIDEPKK